MGDDIGDGAVSHLAHIVFRGNLRREAGHELCALLGPDHIPHLVLAMGAVTLARQLLGRMHLDAEGLAYVEVLDQQGELVAKAPVGPAPQQPLLELGHQFVDGHALAGAVGHHREALGVAGQHPQFRAPNHGAQDRFQPEYHQTRGSAVIASGWGMPMSLRMVGATLQSAPSLTDLTSSPAPMTMNCTSLSEWAVLGLPSSLTA